MCAWAWVGMDAGVRGRFGGRRVRRKVPSVESVSDTFPFRVDKAARLGWFLEVRERPVYLHTFAEEHGGAVMGAGINKQFYCLACQEGHVILF